MVTTLARQASQPASQPVVSLATTQRAMQELIVPGKQASGKIAFMLSVMTIRTQLSRNCEIGDIIRSYASQPLPEDRNVLRAQLGNPMLRTIQSLYEIERLWNDGSIHFNCGTTFQSQFQWRNEMCALIYGMSMKTVSFALHIFNPAHCLLLTIDCWHCSHLGIDQDKLTVKLYIETEMQLYAKLSKLVEEDDRAYWIVTYAACLWERERQRKGKSDAKPGEYQSHAGITCYV